MIPTEHKSKLPGFLSYPVGAEMISSELASMPQFDKLRLSFSYYPSAGDSKGHTEPLTVIVVSFSHVRPTISSSNRFIEEGWYNERWEITVRPVSRESRYEVKKLLLDEGFSRIREWLSAKREPTWLEGRKALNISYDPLDRELLYKEEGTS